MQIHRGSSRGGARADRFGVLGAVGVVLSLLGCDVVYVERPPAPPNEGVYGFANGCFTMDATRPGEQNTRWLRRNGAGDRFQFSALDPTDGALLTLRPTDLGTYLLRDVEGAYLVYDQSALRRETSLQSGVTAVRADFTSPAEWEIQVSGHDPDRFQLRHLATGRYLTRSGTTADEASAGVVAFYPATGCAEFPELSLDAEGEVVPRTFPDGDLFGIADAHEHLFSNEGFGGTGIIHGAPFHRLGVEHALPSCELYHGPEGRRDLVGYFFGDQSPGDVTQLTGVILAAEAPEFQHAPDGYPSFTDWPDARRYLTHQALYYRWIERAYLAGLRLLVQHATGNEVLCEMMSGIGANPLRTTCGEMENAERSIDQTYALERYIDALHGGPGNGWFRVVTSPAEARTAISEGKLAVVLGIETSNLFDCYLTPPPGTAACDEADVQSRLDHFHDRGVRALFPVHKYDNMFSAGDGHRGILELGNVINSGHYSNYGTDCDPSVPPGFDDGDVVLGGLNMPRMDYFEPAPLDTSGFGDNPLSVLIGLLPSLQGGPLVGDYCQQAGLQPLGELLMLEMMKRGMIIEVDHLPQHAYARAFELLEANDYPAAGTHERTNYGRIFALGGIASLRFPGCGTPGSPGALSASLNDRVQEILANGGYPGVPLGFDFNGFALPPRPRFGPESHCAEPQSPSVAYPFTSYDGDVTFQPPFVGERAIDYAGHRLRHRGHGARGHAPRGPRGRAQRRRERRRPRAHLPVGRGLRAHVGAGRAPWRRARRGRSLTPPPRFARGSR